MSGTSVSFAKVSHNHLRESVFSGRWAWDTGLGKGDVPHQPARERILTGVSVGHFGGKSEPGEGEREEPEQAG